MEKIGGRHGFLYQSRFLVLTETQLQYWKHSNVGGGFALAASDDTYAKVERKLKIDGFELKGYIPLSCIRDIACVKGCRREFVVDERGEEHRLWRFRAKDPTQFEDLKTSIRSVQRTLSDPPRPTIFRKKSSQDTGGGGGDGVGDMDGAEEEDGEDEDGEDEDTFGEVDPRRVLWEGWLQKASSKNIVRHYHWRYVMLTEGFGLEYWEAPSEQSTGPQSRSAMQKVPKGVLNKYYNRKGEITWDEITDVGTSRRPKRRSSMSATNIIGEFFVETNSKVSLFRSEVDIKDLVRHLRGHDHVKQQRRVLRSQTVSRTTRKLSDETTPPDLNFQPLPRSSIPGSDAVPPPPPPAQLPGDGSGASTIPPPPPPETSSPSTSPRRGTVHMHVAGVASPVVTGKSMDHEDQSRAVRSQSVLTGSAISDLLKAAETAGNEFRPTPEQRELMDAHPDLSLKVRRITSSHALRPGVTGKLKFQRAVRKLILQQQVTRAFSSTTSVVSKPVEEISSSLSWRLANRQRKVEYELTRGMLHQIYQDASVSSPSRPPLEAPKDSTLTVWCSSQRLDMRTKGLIWLELAKPSEGWIRARAPADIFGASFTTFARPLCPIIPGMTAAMDSVLVERVEERGVAPVVEIVYVATIRSHDSWFNQSQPTKEWSVTRTFSGFLELAGLVQKHLRPELDKVWSISRTEYDLEVPEDATHGCSVDDDLDPSAVATNQLELEKFLRSVLNALSSQTIIDTCWPIVEWFQPQQEQDGQEPALGGAPEPSTSAGKDFPAAAEAVPAAAEPATGGAAAVPEPQMPATSPISAAEAPPPLPPAPVAAAATTPPPVPPADVAPTIGAQEEPAEVLPSLDDPNDTGYGTHVLVIELASVTRLLPGDFDMDRNPYVEFRVAKQPKAGMLQSSKRQQTLDAYWDPNERLKFFVKEPKKGRLLLTVKDWGKYFDDVVIGTASLKLDSVKKREQEFSLPVFDPDNGEKLDAFVGIKARCLSRKAMLMVRMDEVYEYQTYSLFQDQWIAPQDEPAYVNVVTQFNGATLDDVVAPLEPGYSTTQQWCYMATSDDMNGWLYASSRKSDAWFTQNDYSTNIRRRIWMRISQHESVLNLD